MNPASVPELKPVIVAPGGGTSLEALGDRLVVKLAGGQTGGAFSLFECTVPPGGGPPPHFHLHEDELFMVKEGRLSVFVEGCWTEIGPDGVVFAPRGRVHTYRNQSGQPCRFWVMTTPSGFESFFARLARECAAGQPPDMQRVEGICAEHGIHFVPPPRDPEGKCCAGA